MDESIAPPPKRRRSSILQPRRHIAAPTVVDTNAGNDDNEFKNQVFEPKLPSNLTEVTEDKEFLESLLGNLKAEQSSWKNLRAERKLLKNSENGKNQPLQLSWETAEEFLSEDDLQVLKNKPPYEEIAKEFDELMKKAGFLREKYRQCNSLATNMHRLVQSRFDVIKGNIGEHSENYLHIPAPSK